MKQKILTYVTLFALAIPLILIISLAIYELSQMIIDHECTVRTDVQYFKDHDCQKFMQKVNNNDNN